MEQAPATSTDGVRPEVLEAVLSNYYADAVRVGVAARARAQAAQTVVTALAATLLSALTLALKQEGIWARVTGSLAVLAWSVASALFMYAVGSSVKVVADPNGVATADALVRYVLDRAKQERDAVDKRQMYANVAVLVALVFSIATFALVVASPGDEKPRFSLVPNASQRQLLEAQCGSAGMTLTGRLETAPHENGYFDLALDKKSCNGLAVVLRVRKEELKGLVLIK